MQVSKIPLVLGLPLFLGACATAVPGSYTEPKAGFANVASQITPAIGKRTVFAETQAENEALKVRNEEKEKVKKNTLFSLRKITH